ncbi:MAG: YjcZ family sporulation protein [Bacillus sp. (in: Bacteria)]|nr:YjcZ family sporulation protein [Bacillus sp. (in: firmicutes)]
MTHAHTGYAGAFAFILVIFILLVIIGAVVVGGTGYAY